MNMTRHHESVIRAELDALEDEKAIIEDKITEKKSLLQMLMTTLIYIGGKPQKIVKKAILKEMKVSKNGTKYLNSHRDIFIVYVEDK